MFNKLKNSCIGGINSLATNFLMYLPITVLGILICFAINAIWGAELIVVGLVSILSIKELYKTTYNTANYLRNAGYLLLIVAMGTLASMNIFAGFVINFVFIFAFAFVFCDNLSVGRFFVMSLQLLLMQYPGYVGVTDILPRFLCYLFCMAVGGVFLLLFNNLFRKHKDNQYILKGCQEIADKLKSLLDENAQGKLDLFALTTEFCKSKYENMLNQDYLLDEATKNDFLALMTMEQLSDLIYETPSKLTELTEDDIAYFECLIRYFSKIKSLKRLSIDLSNFVDEHSLSNPQLSSLWKKYILTLSSFLKYRGKPVVKTNVKEAVTFRVSVLKKRFTTTSYNMRNALQMSIVVTLCALLSQILPISDAMLCPITALAVLSVTQEKRIKLTITGAVGIITVAVAYMGMLKMFPFDARVPVAFIVSILCLVTAKSIFASVAFSTQMLSAVLFPSSAISPEALLKILYVAVGCAVACFLVEWIFSTPKSQRYKLHTSDLAQFDWSAIHQFEHVRLDDPTKNYLCEIMLIQHLMVEHISNSSHEKVESNKIRYSSMLSFNCDLLTEIAYAMTILRPSKLPKDWILAMKKRLTNIF